MVQHTLFVKNVANTQLRVELQKLLGEKNKIVTVSFTNGKKGVIKHAHVVVESNEQIDKVIELINNKTVNGKEINVAAAKKLQEKASFVARVASLKKLERFRSAWPAPTYKKVANSDPLKNQGFPPAYVHGERLSVQPPKIAKKKVAAPSHALYLTKIPTTVSKKQLLEAFKDVKVRSAVLTKNKKRLNYGFVFFKNADERKKAQEVIKDKIVIGENSIAVHEATKYAKQIVKAENVTAKPTPAAEKKPLTVNAIARKRFAAYRLNLHNRKQRLSRLAAIKKIKERKHAEAHGKVQPRVVRKIKISKAIAKPNPEVAKKHQKKVARKAAKAKAHLKAKKNKVVKKPAAKPVAAAAAAPVQVATA